MPADGSVKNMTNQDSPHAFLRAPMQTVETTKARVAYRKIGSGPSVLFIHGWPLSGNTFRDVATFLASDYTCYVIDLPGAGDSSTYAYWKQPFRQHTDTVKEVIEALGLTRLAIIAHDSGGAIARWVAAEMPGRVSALVLGNTEIQLRLGRAPRPRTGS